LTHVLCQLRFESIKLGVSFIKHSSDGAELRVNRIQGSARRGIERPHISRRSLSRDDHVGVIYPEWLMHAPRAYIGDHGGQTLGKLLLHVEIPLHHVVAFGTGVDIRGTQSVCRKLNILATKIGKWIRTRYQRRRRAFSRGILNHGVGEEWDCLGHKKRKLIEQRLNIEQADAAANGSFSIIQWSPGKTKQRLK